MFLENLLDRKFFFPPTPPACPTCSEPRRPVLLSSTSWSARENPDMVRYIRPGAGINISDISSRGSRGSGSLLGIIYGQIRVRVRTQILTSSALAKRIRWFYIDIDKVGLRIRV